MNNSPPTALPLKKLARNITASWETNWAPDKKNLDMLKT